MLRRLLLFSLQRFRPLHLTELVAETILSSLIGRTGFHHRLDRLRLYRWRQFCAHYWRRQNGRPVISLWACDLCLVFFPERGHLAFPTIFLPGKAFLGADLSRSLVILIRG